MSETGDKPQLGWLPVARLSVDPRYQRTLESRRSQKLIDRLVEKFYWPAFQAIVATEAGDGWLIIDGQHRVEACRRRGETHVPAVLVKNMSVEEQATIFVDANENRVAVNPFALYHAKLLAGDPATVEIQELCNLAGLSIPRYGVPSRGLKEGETLAIGALAKIIKQHGSTHAALAANAVAEAWRKKPSGLRASVFKAAAAVICSDPDMVGRADKITAYLSGMEPSDLFVEAEAEVAALEISREMAIERLLKRSATPQSKNEKMAQLARGATKRTIDDAPFANGTPAGMSETERFRKLVRMGSPIPKIAAAFGISEAEAQKRASALEHAR